MGIAGVQWLLSAPLYYHCWYPNSSHIVPAPKQTSVAKIRRGSERADQERCGRHGLRVPFFRGLGFSVLGDNCSGQGKGTATVC